MIWGAVYIAPLLVPTYDPAVLATGRYVIFGMLSVGLALSQFKEFRHYKIADWYQALLLGVIGNIFYYWVLAMCVKYSGAPIAGAFTAMIPILVAIIGNSQEKAPERRVAWSSLVIPLSMIMVGMVCLNGTEFFYLVGSGRVSSSDFWIGVAFGAVSLFVWTWYPLKNAAWLQANPARSPRSWASAQGVALFPAALSLLAYFWWSAPAERAFWRRTHEIYPHLCGLRDRVLLGRDCALEPDEFALTSCSGRPDDHLRDDFCGDLRAYLARKLALALDDRGDDLLTRGDCTCHASLPTCTRKSARGSGKFRSPITEDCARSHALFAKRKSKLSTMNTP